MLGSVLGLGHGDTSCIMLPAVLAYNLNETIEAQALVSETMGRPGEPAAEVVRDFVESLGLQTRFSQIGVGEDVFPAIARAAMESHYLHNNPRPIRSEGEVIELLKMAL
jgi:alcohol dehydrogenase class IV